MKLITTLLLHGIISKRAAYLTWWEIVSVNPLLSDFHLSCNKTIAVQNGNQNLEASHQTRGVCSSDIGQDDHVGKAKRATINARVECLQKSLGQQGFSIPGSKEQK
ncbi:hypothetical protein N7G274_001788 [Stereocaulon virgatum]|uniref:Uncharacterized protein n=1 Tax=Stereocaulon virgatum TaxID=373712 RepID=A0ABR4ANE9_9LECA